MAFRHHCSTVRSDEWPAERDFFWFHYILAGMGIGFFLRERFNFAREREKKVGVFFVFLCVLCFLGGVFVLFGVLFFVFRALARRKYDFFRRWNEKNRGFPL